MSNIKKQNHEKRSKNSENKNAIGNRSIKIWFPPFQNNPIEIEVSQPVKLSKPSKSNIMTKSQIIETLRLKEANAWERYQSNRQTCQIIVGREVPENEWPIEYVNIVNMYSKEWYAVHEILKELDIMPYSWSEREELKLNFKIK